MTKVVIFDADGTLLDTREYIYQAFEQTLGAHGHKVPTRQDMVAHMGKYLTAMYESLAPGGDHDALVKHHRKLHEGDLLPLVAPYEGLHNLLRTLRESGWKIAVCTSRGKHAAELLKKVGVAEDIDVLVTGDDVTHHKPHPEALLKALQALGESPESAVMIGDTTADIGAGKAAGVAYTIGLTHGFSEASTLQGAGADYVVDHLDHVLRILEERPL